MKLKIRNGILIIDILSVLLILSIAFFPSTGARVILGLPFLLFFPGYTLVAALFVNNKGIDNIARIALSCGMSIAVTGLIGFGLNYTTWGIRLEPVLYSIAAFIFVTSSVALVRRARILKTNIFTSEFTLNLPGWRGSPLNNSLSIILLILILAAFATLGYTIAHPKIGEKFTEVYILGLNGKAQDYPTEFTMDNGKVTQIMYGDGTFKAMSGAGLITLGIVNHEQQTVGYFVKMTIDGEAVNIDFGGTNNEKLGPIELRQGEKWENAIGIVPQRTGDNQNVELLLFKGTDSTAIDSLHFWINVK